MRRRQSEMGGKGRGAIRSILFVIAVSMASCIIGYLCVMIFTRRPQTFGGSQLHSMGNFVEEEDDNTECCRGIDHLELWGEVVKWGTDFKFSNKEECCSACKDMCKVAAGPCLCNSWVFCGDKKMCKDKFGECWLKMQNDALMPETRQGDDSVEWTSGLIFGKEEGIIGLHTEYGTLHVKLFPECAPYSVVYITALLGIHHCVGCQIYRAENRGFNWDINGNHIPDASIGPPYALIQGTLEAEGFPFKDIPKETCPKIRRGSVAWIGSGPEFIISLANHNEWKRKYTVFGSVLPEDMDIAEKIVNLPTNSDVWSNIQVSVLNKSIPLKLERPEKKQKLF
ncbi:hypothetical protein ZOSMA_366G00100 [Zostera marina]|uniref:PPIase cyclophilin-type domain-containing protein n=1 Tax=Zostera marina TaxID=29655 RepID=A0A0K9P8M3_ZOSMR|nr:hypothetical protein ZOSMA_366G00100 [Zostera marina]